MRVLLSALELAIGLAAVVAALFRALPETRIGRYTDGAGVLALAGALLALGAAFQLFGGLQTGLSCGLRGAGETRWPCSPSRRWQGRCSRGSAPAPSCASTRSPTCPCARSA